jgi:hypothetical protein
MGSSQIPIFLVVFLQTYDSPKLSLWVLIRLGMRHMRQTTAGGAYEGSPHAGSPFTGALGFGGFSGTIFGDAFRGGMDEKVSSIGII